MFLKIDIMSKKKVDISSGKLSVKKKPSYKIEKKNLNVKAEKADIEVEWYSENSKTSKRLEYEFTNFVDGILSDYQTSNAVDVLNTNINSIKDNTLDTININKGEKGKRLQDIINLYLDVDGDSQEEYWFVKTDINTPFQIDTNNRGSFRVIMVNMKDMESKKHYLQIVFLDPYHLFVLAKDKGKSAEEVKENTYRLHKDLDVCLSKHIN